MMVMRLQWRSLFSCSAILVLLLLSSSCCWLHGAQARPFKLNRARSSRIPSKQLNSSLRRIPASRSNPTGNKLKPTAEKQTRSP